MPIPNQEAKEKDPDLNFREFEGEDGKKYKLSLRQISFCHAYLEFKGNGVEAVCQAGYKVKNARVAAAIAYENLTKPHICAYITSKLTEYGFNDDNVTKQHLYVINQFADLHAKNKGIDMFYKRKSLYPPERIEINEFAKEETPQDEIDRKIEKLKKDVHK